MELALIAFGFMCGVFATLGVVIFVGGIIGWLWPESKEE